MQHKGIIGGGIVLLLIICGMFIFAYMQKTEQPQPELKKTTPNVIENKYAEITSIDAKHFFKDGTHTLVGEVQFETACDLLSWDTFIAESFPEQVRIDFSAINHADTCERATLPQRFRIDFDASEEASIKARLNGLAIRLNLFEAGPEETPDDFELFIKG